jgi:REP element-mobilizing transposase RayT
VNVPVPNGREPNQPLPDGRAHNQPLPYGRGSDRSGDHEQNRDREGAAKQAAAHGPLADACRERSARRRCRQAPITLNAEQRRIVEEAVLEVIARKNWSLHELSVRSNHVHVVVSAPEHPDRVVNTFKSISTRRLREARLSDASIKPWNRGGSRKYLWTPEALEAACRYVLDGQGPDI